jgi:hypothetical protein
MNQCPTAHGLALQNVVSRVIHSIFFLARTTIRFDIVFPNSYTYVNIAELCIGRRSAAVPGLMMTYTAYAVIRERFLFLFLGNHPNLY